MKIKDFLKKYKITLKELSEILNLSRPTLNSYIEQYELNGKISNNYYNTIFTKIFNQNWSKKEDIIEEINALKNLTSKNSTLEEEYCSENIELINSIKEKMYKDMKGQKEVLPLYKFINSVLYNYNVDEGLTGYIDYNLYLNGLKDITTLDSKEKILVSKVFPIMKKYVNNKLTFDPDGYEDFLARIEEIQLNRKLEAERIEKEFREKIKAELELKFNLGKHIDKEKIEEILSKIKF